MRRFGCVYCGEDVNYVKEQHQLVCSNPECPEEDGWNPLQGCVWVKTSEKVWESVPKKYVLTHIDEFSKEVKHSNEC